MQCYRTTSGSNHVHVPCSMCALSECMSKLYTIYLQLGRIYLDMVNVYKVLSENISSAVSVSGESNCSTTEHVCIYLHQST